MTPPRPLDDSVPLWRLAVGKLASAFLGGVFLVAAFAKAIDPDAFVEQISRQSLDFLIPASFLALIAIAVETAVGAGLLLGIDRKWFVGMAGALVVLLVLITARAYWLYSQGLLDEGDCGCFGNLVQRTPEEALLGDFLLLIPPFLLVIWGRGAARGFPLLRVAVMVLAMVGAALFAFLAPGLPLDDLATQLSPEARLDQICMGGDSNRVCFDEIVPAAGTGEHLVILTDLESPEFVQALPQVNQYFFRSQGPTLWVATAAEVGAIQTFVWTAGPAFEFREAPQALMRTMYRKLPRSFLVKDGVVTETFNGMPPLRELAGRDSLTLLPARQRSGRER